MISYMKYSIPIVHMLFSLYILVAYWQGLSRKLTLQQQIQFVKDNFLQVSSSFALFLVTVIQQASFLEGIETKSDRENTACCLFTLLKPRNVKTSGRKRRSEQLPFLFASELLAFIVKLMEFKAILVLVVKVFITKDTF